MLRTGSLLAATGCDARLIEFDALHALGEAWRDRLLDAFSDKPLFINCGDRPPPSSIATLFVLISADGRARSVGYEELVKVALRPGETRGADEGVEEFFE